ncbi:endonuclease/exonuclease/phosphatase family protein [Actinopolymorpha pittospori]|uniref:Extracellular nuclease n=1 Tax=Actinopolymorpha pittospori TaxID=648752 RepID=A0A927RMT0_9ACTN|nr:endonuclease/exonuclease/phosphatase family protein [Actinopolymorpha pittospori]MBE1610456.1 putative extracellular nuclease [Actinopolymorpha pittospori]
MARHRLRTMLAAGSTLALGLGGLTFLTVPASAASVDLVLNEVYGGGGNTGATFTHDFVELANRGDAPVELAGLSLQYGSSTGNLGGGSTPGSGNLKVDLHGTVAPGGTFLVQLAPGSGNGEALPTPDLASTTLNLSGSTGKVALVRGTNVLACGSTCAADPAIVDFLGYGAANDFEGHPAPATANATSSTRGTGADTDDNAADFTTGAPTPRNAAGETGGGGPEPEPEKARIPAIQGGGHRSPFAGKRVETTGVVTASKFDGYWVQDATGDGDDDTSDGIYVFATATGAKPTVGQAVTVTGTVTEYRPSSASGPNLALTEIENAKFAVLPEALPMPAPVLIGPGGRVAPAQNPDSGGAGRVDVETAGEFRPDRDAVDFYEALESMRVEVRDAEVVGPTNSYGEMVVVPGGTDLPRTRAGGVRYAAYDTPNTQRITVDDEIIYQRMPSANVGDTLPGLVSGPLSYDFGMFRIYPAQVPQVRSGGLAKEVTAAPNHNELAIASFNVENLDPTDPAEKVDQLASTIVHNLAAPDVLALEEVQDDTGAECPDGPSPTCTPDGVVTADQTLRMLTEAITAAGGPAYQWREISPQNLTDGGEPTGNIRVAFLFRPDRGVQFVDRPGGDATTPTGVQNIDGKAALTLSPGRIAPTDDAWANSRKPLAGEFSYHGRTVFVIANHFNSKGGDEPIMGRWQPPTRSSEQQRHQQAVLVHDFVADILAVQKDARVIVAGDLNDFEFSQTSSLLREDGTLVSLPTLLPEQERYSYVFDGNSQVLDQILVSPALVGKRSAGLSGRVRGYDIVHVNAEFADQVSDHDPQVVRITP